MAAMAQLLGKTGEQIPLPLLMLDVCSRPLPLVETLRRAETARVLGHGPAVSGGNVYYAGQEARPLEALEPIETAAMAVRAAMAPVLLRAPELDWLAIDLTRVFEGLDLKTWTPIMTWFLQRDLARTLLVHFHQKHGEEGHLFLHLWLRTLARTGPLAVGKKASAATVTGKFEQALQSLCI